MNERGTGPQPCPHFLLAKLYISGGEGLEEPDVGNAPRGNRKGKVTECPFTPGGGGHGVWKASGLSIGIRGPMAPRVQERGPRQPSRVT